MTQASQTKFTPVICELPQHVDMTDSKTVTIQFSGAAMRATEMLAQHFNRRPTDVIRIALANLHFHVFRIDSSALHNPASVHEIKDAQGGAR